MLRYLPLQRSCGGTLTGTHSAGVERVANGRVWVNATLTGLMPVNAAEMNIPAIIPNALTQPAANSILRYRHRLDLLGICCPRSLKQTIALYHCHEQVPEQAQHIRVGYLATCAVIEQPRVRRSWHLRRLYITGGACRRYQGSRGRRFRPPRFLDLAFAGMEQTAFSIPVNGTTRRAPCRDSCAYSGFVAAGTSRADR